jgi:hypothetical protein
MPFDEYVISVPADKDLRRLGYQISREVCRYAEGIKDSEDYRRITREHRDGRSGIRCFDVPFNEGTVRVGFNIPQNRNLLYITSVIPVVSEPQHFELRFFVHTKGATPPFENFVEEVLNSGPDAFSYVVQVVVMMLGNRLTPKLSERLKRHRNLSALRPEWEGTEYRMHYYQTRVDERQVFVLLNGYVEKSKGSQRRAINEADKMLQTVRGNIDAFSVEMWEISMEPLRSFCAAIAKSLDER